MMEIETRSGGRWRKVPAARQPSRSTMVVVPKFQARVENSHPGSCPVKFSLQPAVFCIPGVSEDAFIYAERGYPGAPVDPAGEN